MRLHAQRPQGRRKRGPWQDKARVLERAQSPSLACTPALPDDAPEDLASTAARTAQQAEMEAEFEQGMQALIVGALALLEERA